MESSLFCRIFKRNQTPAQFARVEILEGLATNFQGQRFVPANAVNSIFTQNLVHEIIASDASLKKSLFSGKCGPWRSKAGFAHYVCTSCRSILALFILTEVKLRLLFHVLRNCHAGDVPLLDRRLQAGDCPTPTDQRDFEILLAQQSIFSPYSFGMQEAQQPAACPKLPPSTVVPVISNLQDPKLLLGQGKYCKVYHVKIPATYQNFSTNPSTTFALKVSLPDRHSRESFTSELCALTTLHHSPYPNLLLHHAAWIQNDIGHIIFPYATESLADRMTRPPPPMNIDSTGALLRNLAGIASGLEHLHSATHSPQPHEPGRNGTSASQKQDFMTFLHLDIKASNILIFDNGHRDENWRIGDFGSLAILPITASNPQEAHSLSLRCRYEGFGGDYVYEPPDRHQTGYITQAYDVWSLGCVFLEIMLWALTPPGRVWKAEDFAGARLLSPQPERGTVGVDDRFWFAKKGAARVKPVVMDGVTGLREQAEKMGVGALEGMAEVVEGMLCVDVQRRWRAEDVRRWVEGVGRDVEGGEGGGERARDTRRGRNGERTAKRRARSASAKRSVLWDEPNVPSKRASSTSLGEWGSRESHMT